MRSGTVRFRQYTAYSEKKQQVRGVKCSVFAENTELNGTFLAITRYSRKSDYVQDFTLNLTKFLNFWTSALSSNGRCQKNVKN
jgi:hypothetical protein